MTPDVALLVNPTAGRGRAGTLAASAAARLRARGLDTQVLTGTDAAGAEALAHEAVQAGCRALLALGGDGLVHIAVQAVAGGPTPLGVLAGGTGNDFAGVLGLPTGPGAVGLGADLAADALISGARRRVDAVSATRADGPPRWWCNVLGAGFDSAVNERANRMRWPAGPRRYDLAIVAELRTFRPFGLELICDGTSESTAAMMVAVGNGRSYGAGMKVTPNADPADGLLDVTVLTPVSKPTFVRAFPRVYKGTHIDLPYVWTRRAAVVELRADRQVAYADGERFGALPVRCELVPGALTMLGAPPPAR